MHLKKIRHFLGRLLGIRKYLFMAELGKTLNLDGMLGSSLDASLRSNWRMTARRLFTEHEIQPRGAVHCGVCTEADLTWYASAGFDKVLVVASSSTLALAVPAGLTLIRAEGGAPEVQGAHEGIHKPWEVIFSDHAAKADEFTFISFPHAEWLAKGPPSFVQAVHGRFPATGAAVASFGEHGLALAYVGTPDANGHTDALFLRKPVVTMSDFGRNGRFGNQLFQRSYLRLVALRQGAILQLPLWAGTALFDSIDPPPSGRALPEVKEESLDIETRRLLSTKPDPGFAGMDYRGYGMSHTSLFAGHKKLIRAEHVFDARLTARFDAIMGPLLAGGKKLIVIHLRRGDYGYGQFFRAPCAWYQEWMSRQGFTPATHVLYICSEDPGRYRARFAGFTVITADDLGTPRELAPYFDFLAMTQADALAVANSSFSFFAAMINARAGAFVRPDALRGGLVPFDPWDAEPLLDQKLSPEEHLRLKEID